MEENMQIKELIAEVGDENIYALRAKPKPVFGFCDQCDSMGLVVRLAVVTVYHHDITTQGVFCMDCLKPHEKELKGLLK
jgi:hypothetical protein